MAKRQSKRDGAKSPPSLPDEWTAPPRFPSEIAEARRWAEEYVARWHEGQLEAWIASTLYQRPEQLRNFLDAQERRGLVDKSGFLDNILCELAALHLEQSQLPEPVRKCATKALREATKKNSLQDLAWRDTTIVCMLFDLKEGGFPLFPNRAGPRPGQTYACDIVVEALGKIGIDISVSTIERCWKNRASPSPTYVIFEERLRMK